MLLFIRVINYQQSMSAALEIFIRKIDRQLSMNWFIIFGLVSFYFKLCEKVVLVYHLV